MGRYRGHIQIVDDSRASHLGRVTNQAMRRDACGRSVGLGIGSLLLIALVAVFALDAAEATVAAGVALVTGVFRGLWAFRSSTSRT